MHHTAPRSRTVARAAALAAALLALTSCQSADSPSGPSVQRLRVWAHSGTPQERDTLTAQVTEWDRSRSDVDVDLRIVTEGDYNDAIQAAAASGDLPDVLEVDGPVLGNLDYQGVLADLGPVLPAGAADDLLPSLRAQGTARGRLVGVGTFESGLGLFASRSRLRAAGVRVPTGLADAWTGAELEAALRALAAKDPDRKVLDLKLAYGTGEWLTYGFSPLLWSAGADLVDRRTGLATGVLDGPAGVRAMTALQRWSRYVDPDPKDSAFVRGDVALSWVGHWAYPDYAKALGDDLVVLPLPDLGGGPKTGQGSWTWGVAETSRAKGAAGELLAFLLRTDQVSRTALANGAVPGTVAALAASPLYGRGGRLELLGEQLSRTCGSGAVTQGCVAVPRPVTPAYPVVTARVAHAVADVLAGKDVATSLRTAAAAVDADNRANKGYR